MPFTYDNATGGQEGQPEEKGDNRWYAFSSPVLIYRKKIDCAYTANVVSNCRDDDEGARDADVSRASSMSYFYVLRLFVYIFF